MINAIRDMIGVPMFLLSRLLFIYSGKILSSEGLEEMIEEYGNVIVERED